MKTILICPSQPNGIAVLADSNPPVTLPILGKSFICYWMHHLASSGFKEVRIVTTDPKELIEEYVEDGSRWGLKVEVFHEVRDLKPAEARQRYRPAYENDWAPDSQDVIEADHLPGLPDHKLFASYESWFHALALWLPHLGRLKPVGLKEIQPGVWVGRRARIATSARLTGPCWLGDNVRIGKNAQIGPMSFVEERSVIEANCVVSNSWVGPDTYVGSLTELKDSLAWGQLLVNWKTGSHTLVPDPFLMASLLKERKGSKKQERESVAPALATSLTRPFGTVISLAQKLQS